jgi:hypothetical protein
MLLSDFKIQKDWLNTIDAVHLRDQISSME